MQITNNALIITIEADGSGLTITAPGWEALCLGPLAARLTVNGENLRVSSRTVDQTGNDITLTTNFEPLTVSLVQRFSVLDDNAIRLSNILHNRTDRTITLHAVQLLTLDSGQQGIARLSAEPASVRIYERSHLSVRVRGMGTVPQRQTADGETPPDMSEKHSSLLVWVSYDSAAKQAFLVGFETENRWSGRIATEGQPGAQPSHWAVGFDGGDTWLDPGETVLEDVLLLAGSDPLALLESYGDRTAARHGFQALSHPPISWESWYPYRLGVTEERMLANTAMAAERLKPLGLRYMEVDLGWERGQLPNTFEENEQFPHGLKWLSERIEEHGFELGVWKAPFCISDLDVLPKEHPEWLLGGEGKKPLPLGQWFWEPHGETYGLDLTHPEAQAWLRKSIRSLAERGVRYLLSDFMGVILNSRLRDRHNPRIVAGGGAEAARIGMKIIMEELRAGKPDAIAMPVVCPYLPGEGSFPLLYVCNDTGNTGYVGWKFLSEDLGKNVAGHLWQNKRWGIIQPSTTCLGLPGTLEEARLRATAVFLSGGFLEVGDELTTLPEDRWQVLEASLPLLGKTARPLDLFEPFSVTSLDYEGMCRGEEMGDLLVAPEEQENVSRVWHVPVEADWDSWNLYGLFNYDVEKTGPQGKHVLITRYRLPLERLGLNPEDSYWVHEFWSGQFLGTSPFVRENPRGYKHPGDVQPLISSPNAQEWEVSFFGPAVKLLVVRRARLHPWVVATSFHQSGGTEIANVEWKDGALRGELHRSAGQQGHLVIAGAQEKPKSALVGGQPVIVRRGANGSLLVPVLTKQTVTSWELHWQ